MKRNHIVTAVLFRRNALIEMIKLLLRRGANPNSSLVPFPVLFFALKTADPAGVENLLSKGASTETRLPKEKGGLAPLHIAVTLPGDAGVQITKLLLEAGANPNIQAYPYDSEPDTIVSCNLLLQTIRRRDHALSCQFILSSVCPHF